MTNRLALQGDRLPFPPNKKVFRGEDDLGDVDFCFAIDDILVNLDMKSWQRNSNHFVGHHHTYQERQDSILKNLGKVERRGAELLAQLNAPDRKFSKCINFLIVALPEYLDPKDARLWYAAPVDFPKVVTPAELIEFMLDKPKRTLLIERLD